MTFTIQSSYLLLLFLIVFATLAITLLYHRRFQDNPYPKQIRVLLLFLRLSSVFLLLLLLFRPSFQWWNRTEIKPQIALVVDQSSSMISGRDSLSKRKMLTEYIRNLEAKLSPNFELTLYGVDQELHDSVDFRFNGLSSNYSAITSQFSSDHSHTNLVSMVMVGDGLYNVGADPTNHVHDIPTPIFSIAHGDTTSYRDAVVKKLYSPEIAFVDRPFVLGVQIQQKALKGRNAKVQLLEKGKLIDSKELLYTKDNEFFEFSFEVTPKNIGFVRYQVRLTLFDDEVVKNNNVATLSVEVKDNRSKVVMLYTSVHPDLGAIRRSLERNGEYDVVLQQMKSWDGNLEDVDLLVVHTMGKTKANSSKWSSKLKKSKVPSLFIFGSGCSESELTEFQNFVSYSQQSVRGEQASPAFDHGFGLFTLNDATADLFSSLPPLESPYGSWDQNKSTTNLLFQSIQGVQTDFPLWVFHSTPRKQSAILGSGIWRWSVYDFLSSGSFERFDNLMSKSVEWLLLKENKDRFRLQYERKIPEYESVKLEAEVYDDVFEFVQDATVELKLKNEDGEEFVYGMLLQGNRYLVDLDRMSAGTYTFEATASYRNQTNTKRGQFVIERSLLEQQENEADFAMMQNLAFQSGGLFFTIDQENSIQAISDSLTNRYGNKFKQITQPETSFFIDLEWLLFLLVLLLTSEWALRKFYGKM